MPDGSTHQFPASEAHAAHIAFQNVAWGIEGLINRIRGDLAELDRIQGSKPEGSGEYLAQIIEEHLRDQYAEALRASREWSDQDPLNVELVEAA